MDGPKDDMAKSVSANAEKNHVRKAKRKPGRPLAYQGDPFSPDVTPDERRVILRRVANRESARRVRVRHNESMERAFKEAECLERSNSILYQKLDRAQAFEARLQTDLAQLHKEVIAKGCENAHLCTVIARMRDQEATMRLLQASIKDLLPKVLGNESCTDFAIQPDTIDGLNARKWSSIASLWGRVFHTYHLVQQQNCVQDFLQQTLQMATCFDCVEHTLRILLGHAPCEPYSSDM